MRAACWSKGWISGSPSCTSAESAALLTDYDEPLAALASVIENLLDSEESLGRFVTKVDAEWGRLYSELPHFDRSQRPPDPDDPYTLASVRATLAALYERLEQQR